MGPVFTNITEDKNYIKYTLEKLIDNKIFLDDWSLTVLRRQAHEVHDPNIKFKTK